MACRRSGWEAGCVRASGVPKRSQKMRADSRSHNGACRRGIGDVGSWKTSASF